MSEELSGAQKMEQKINEINDPPLEEDPVGNALAAGVAGAAVNFAASGAASLGEEIAAGLGAYAAEGALTVPSDQGEAGNADSRSDGVDEGKQDADATQGFNMEQDAGSQGFNMEQDAGSQGFNMEQDAGTQQDFNMEQDAAGQTFNMEQDAAQSDPFFDDSSSYD